MGLFIDYDAGDIDLNLSNCMAVKRADNGRIEIWSEDGESFIGAFNDFCDSVDNAYIADLIIRAYNDGIKVGVEAGKSYIKSQFRNLIFEDVNRNQE
jgi:hypothetical protein